MMLRADRAEERRQTAKDLVEERAKRSAEDQLALLDHKLGKGVGAAKERARLVQQIADRKTK